MIISVDCGRDSVKSIGKKELTFPSTVGKYYERTLSTDGNYEVIIDGKKYFIGELANTENNFPIKNTEKSKLHEQTKILTLSAVGVLANEEEVNLVTGLPVSQHNPENKARLTELLKGHHDISINGKQKHVNIQNVLITIEGAGILFNENVHEDIVRVIDIGSVTTNFLTSLHGKFINKDSYTDEGNSGIKFGYSKEGKEEFADFIISKINSFWPDYNGEPLLLGGGGALIVGDHIKEKFPAAYVVKNPITANAKGFYNIGVGKWQ